MPPTNPNLAPAASIMLQRNLLYTAITLAKRLVVLVGSKRAIAIAIKNNHVQLRYTNLNGKASERQRHVSAGRKSITVLPGE